MELWRASCPQCAPKDLISHALALPGTCSTSLKSSAIRDSSLHSLPVPGSALRLQHPLGNGNSEGLEKYMMHQGTLQVDLFTHEP